MRYVGFWWRGLATLIDAVVLGVLLEFTVSMILGNSVDLVALAGMNPEQIQTQLDPQAILALLKELIAALVACVLLVAFYEVVTTASPLKGTPGKWLLGIAVVDEQGKQLGFGASLGRHAAKGVSAMLLMVGFIMAAFDARKQGLHDKMCKTLVVKRQSLQTGEAS